MNTDSQKTCDVLMSLVAHTKRMMHSIADAHGLTSVQLLTLHSIEQHGDYAMSKVAEALHCDASNVTGIVDRLVAQGLVLRQEGEQDRRRKTLRLTPKGQETVTGLKAELVGRMGCERLSDDERVELQTIVQKIGA